MGIIGDLKRVYSLLGSEDYNLDIVREILAKLKEKGVDKGFMATVFQILAKEEMVKALMEEFNQK